MFTLHIHTSLLTTKGLEHVYGGHGGGYCNSTTMPAGFAVCVAYERNGQTSSQCADAFEVTDMLSLPRQDSRGRRVA
jgi:hypothetical protein